jgi:hypothetical protein
MAIKSVPQRMLEMLLADIQDNCAGGWIITGMLNHFNMKNVIGWLKKQKLFDHCNIHSPEQALMRGWSNREVPCPTLGTKVNVQYMKRSLLSVEGLVSRFNTKT